MSWVPEIPYEPTMPAVVRRAVEEFGDADFIVLPDRRITFREAEVASRQLAKELLAAGVGKGSRVGIHLPTGPEWAVAWMAATRIGALTMPFSTLYRPAELRKAMRIGDVAVLLSSTTMLGKDHESYLEEAIPGLESSSGGPLRLPELPYLRSVRLLAPTGRRWADVSELSTSDTHDVDGIDDSLLAAVEREVTPADLMLVVFTSGTTAEPKGVIHTQGAVLRKTAPVVGAGMDASFPGRPLSYMPFFWIGGIQSVAGALQSGAAVLTLERLDPMAALELAKREQATSINGNATTLQALMSSSDAAAFSHLKLTMSGLSGPHLPKRPWEGDPSSKGDQPTALGMTETMGAWAGIDGFDCRVVDPDTGKEVAPDQEGEFFVRGYSLMEGLYKREREDVFTPDGFFATGDIGYLENGLVYFRGRRTHMIKSKGANIAPAEVEAVLNASPDVKVSFVVGLPHDDYGEEVAAALVPEPGHVIDVDRLLQEARSMLSSYKVPTFVEVVRDEDITWLPSSKVDTRAVARLLDRARQAKVRG
ncbi:MAG: acyl--CoA ligase [Acidimicrobiaceae bacterium]|nr:acyl--CoA ligase [Acidimicrobiaceae bacterium]